MLTRHGAWTRLELQLPESAYAPRGFDAGDANLRRVVGNAPTNATDPSGLIDVAPAPRSRGPFTEEEIRAAKGMPLGYVQASDGTVIRLTLGIAKNREEGDRLYISADSNKNILNSVRWLQFVRRRDYDKEKKPIVYNPDSIEAKNIIETNIAGLLTPSSSDVFRVDPEEKKKTNPYYPLGTSNENSIRLEDRPGMLPLKTGVASAAAEFEAFLVYINNGKVEVLFMVQWNLTKTGRNQADERFTVTRVKSYPELPKYLEEDQLFGGYQKYKDKKLSDPFYYDNPIPKDQRKPK
jgi:hypothetical protein